MGERTRENTRNFFSLDFLTGNNARREANRQEAAATQLFQDQLFGQERAGVDDIYSAENAVYADPTAQYGLINDASYQAGTQAQLQALRQMQGIAGAGGYTGLERDQVAQAQRQAAASERSQRDAQVQQMQMRGMAGGGGEMAARLQAQQGGANRAASDATNIATQAQMRALQAMQSGAQIGQGQQANAVNRAQAIDAFNQANTNRQQGVNQRNAAGRTAAVNQAQQNRTDATALLGGQYNSNAGRRDDQAQQQQALLQGIIGAVV
jgi:hypothetical protein